MIICERVFPSWHVAAPVVGTHLIRRENIRKLNVCHADRPRVEITRKKVDNFVSIFPSGRQQPWEARKCRPTASNQIRRGNPIDPLMMFLPFLFIFYEKKMFLTKLWAKYFSAWIHIYYFMIHGCFMMKRYCGLHTRKIGYIGRVWKLEFKLSLFRAVLESDILQVLSQFFVRYKTRDLIHNSNEAIKFCMTRLAKTELN